jgi:hypothetical protein
LIVEGGLQKGIISLCGSSVRGTWRGAPLLGIPKEWGGGLWGQVSLSMGALLGSLEGARLLGIYVLKKALETGTFLHRGPVKNHRGSFHQKL